MTVVGGGEVFLSVIFIVPILPRRLWSLMSNLNRSFGLLLSLVVRDLPDFRQSSDSSEVTYLLESLLVNRMKRILIRWHRHLTFPCLEIWQYESRLKLWKSYYEAVCIASCDWKGINWEETSIPISKMCHEMVSASEVFWNNKIYIHTRKCANQENIGALLQN